MAPKVKMFKSDSIIYFKGDKADSVFLLKSGQVVLEYNDIQNDEPIKDIINSGEFFGVKSGLVKYPREEDAKTTADSQIIEFSTPDFEALITKNTSIILKMLKVFSNQLRKIGKEVQSLVTDKVTSDTTGEFFNIGEYYLKNKRYSQSIAVYKRFLSYYPNDRRANLIKDRIATAQQCLQNYGDEGGPALHLEVSEDQLTGGSAMSYDNDILNEQNTVSASEDKKIYEEAVGLMNQKKYMDAFAEFKKVITGNDAVIKKLAAFQIGKCFFNVQKFAECIKQLQVFAGKYPSMPEAREALYYCAMAYAKLGDNENAKNAARKVVGLSNNKVDDLYKSAVKLYKELP